jgi:hypothetical protein
MMTEKIEKYRTVSVDSDTDDGLNWLKERLDSPKAWILKRLVNAEIQRVRGKKQ